MQANRATHALPCSIRAPTTAIGQQPNMSRPSQSQPSKWVKTEGNQWHLTGGNAIPQNAMPTRPPKPNRPPIAPKKCWMQQKTTTMRVHKLEHEPIKQVPTNHARRWIPNQTTQENNSRHGPSHEQGTSKAELVMTSPMLAIWVSITKP